MRKPYQVLSLRYCRFRLGVEGPASSCIYRIIYIASILQFLRVRAADVTSYLYDSIYIVCARTVNTYICDRSCSLINPLSSSCLFCFIFAGFFSSARIIIQRSVNCFGFGEGHKDVPRSGCTVMTLAGGVESDIEVRTYSSSFVCPRRQCGWLFKSTRCQLP